MYPMAREFEKRSFEIPLMICVHTNRIDRSDALVLFVAETQNYVPSFLVYAVLFTNKTEAW